MIPDSVMPKGLFSQSSGCMEDTSQNCEQEVYEEGKERFVQIPLSSEFGPVFLEENKGNSVLNLGSLKIL